jgi:CheY-like chemotaxis protein
MRLIIKSALQICGLPIQQFFLAGDGSEGLKVLSREAPDIVLIDLNMPVMGGLEMIGNIRSNPAWAGLRMVVISTEFSKERIQEIEQMGIPFIHKPFSPDEISNKLAPMTETA